MKIEEKTIMTWRNIALMTVLSIGLLAYALTVFYRTVYLDPERTFWATIDNNLSTRAVTKVTSESNPSQEIRQAQTLDLNGEVSVSNKVTINGADQEVDLQTIGYFGRDYLRYNTVQLSDAEQEAIVADAVGVWATQDIEGVAGGGQQPVLLQEALLSSFVIFANLDAQQKSEVSSLLRGSYKLDLTDGFTEEEVDGRTVYTYDVDVELTSFAQATATYLRGYGLDDLAGSFESQSATGGEVPISISVDARSRRVVGVTSGVGTPEEYTAYGVETRIEEPETDITYQQLQQLINE